MFIAVVSSKSIWDSESLSPTTILSIKKNKEIITINNGNDLAFVSKSETSVDDAVVRLWNSKFFADNAWDVFKVHRHTFRVYGYEIRDVEKTRIVSVGETGQTERGCIFQQGKMAYLMNGTQSFLSQRLIDKIRELDCAKFDNKMFCELNGVMCNFMEGTHDLGLKHSEIKAGAGWTHNLIAIELNVKVSDKRFGRKTVRYIIDNTQEVLNIQQYNYAYGFKTQAQRDLPMPNRCSPSLHADGRVSHQLQVA